MERRRSQALEQPTLGGAEKAQGGRQCYNRGLSATAAHNPEIKGRHEQRVRPNTRKGAKALTPEINW